MRGAGRPDGLPGRPERLPAVDAVGRGGELQPTCFGSLARALVAEHEREVAFLRQELLVAQQRLGYEGEFSTSAPGTVVQLREPHGDAEPSLEVVPSFQVDEVVGFVGNLVSDDGFIKGHRQEARAKLPPDSSRRCSDLIAIPVGSSRHTGAGPTTNGAGEFLGITPVAPSVLATSLPTFEHTASGQKEAWQTEDEEYLRNATADTAAVDDTRRPSNSSRSSGGASPGGSSRAESPDVQQQRSGLPVLNRRGSRERIAWTGDLTQKSFIQRTFDRLFGWFIRPRLHKMSTLQITELQNQSPLWRFMNSAPVRYTCCAIILMNSVFIGLQTEMVLKIEMSNEATPVAWDAIEFFFSAWFAVELILRLVAERWLFFTGPEKRWNALDSVLVLSSAFEILSASVRTPNFTAARLLRFMRFTRIFRVLRVMRACQNFRVMVFAILHSMSALLYAVVVLSFFKYCFAIIFIHGTAEYLKDGREAELQLAFFGSLARAWVSLFEAITGGRDWCEIYGALVSIHWLYGLIFIIYIYFMVFLVLNVVVGTVVKTTSEVFRKDRQHIVDDELNKLNSYTKEIKEFFKDADTDCSGTLSWDEFNTYLRDDKVKAYFQTLALDISQAHVLFTLLDLDGSDSVSVEEFVDGCVRLKGEAKSIDVNMLLHQVEKLLHKVGKFSEECSSNMSSLAQHMGINETLSPRSRRNKAKSAYSMKSVKKGGD
eukprot:TRINITY_DN20981_c0_g4_i1.p1 TRINITY_DN20981_c0_g4~~TRINITY_DN20981_c0_g4_i1.p1  ORF type:complete len:713 (-),score=113.89 TRINITY_DN20981_c0_g4_i1:167-2305(-)